MHVPFLDVAAACREVRPGLDAAYARVVDSANFILGPEVQAFEGELAAALGAKGAAGVGNGLDAIVLALRALGVGPGDEVLVPSNTFIATWLAVSYVGAKPIPVEPRPETHNMDPEAARRSVTSRTRAMVPVHLYGQPAEMQPLLELAEEHGLGVVEDAAQAHGARYNGTPAGSLARVAAFSFYPGKNLGALGDGGAVVTSDAEILERVRVLRNYGSRRKYVHEERGVNSRLDELQAAFLRVRLARLDEWNARRRSVARRYSSGLADARDVILPHVPPGMEPAWHLFVVRSNKRDALQARLRAAGIETLIHYPCPPNLQGAYAGSYPRQPIAESLSAEVLSLPMGPHLTDEQVEHVIAEVAKR